jgi:hypothetical protein
MPNRTTRLIKLGDGTLVEVEATEDDVQQVSAKDAETRLNQTLDNIQPLLVRASQPFIAALKNIGQDADIDSAELELGFSFEGEGDVYIAKFKGGANLLIRVSLKPSTME